MPPISAVEESYATISQFSPLNGQRKAELQLWNGIVEGSNLFRLPNIKPYKSFPIAVMHLFYNIGKDLLRLWCGGGCQRYILGRNAIRESDAELQAFGDGIASEIGARPRPLSRFKDWKSSEIKTFILNCSLVVLDGYLPEPYLNGWKSFVELVDICWRPVLSKQDIADVGRLAREFCEKYEKHYYKYDVDRMNP